MALYTETDQTGKPATDDDGIVREAMERWKSCEEWQGVEDERARQDIKFANGDARNAFQWPEKIYQDRTGGESELPCLTINNTRTHNDLVINAMSKNRFSAKIRPTGGKASYKSAEMMETLVKRTQYISRYSSQKRKVAEQQVDGGIGYILLETRYVSERSFDQDVYLRASRDPTGVYVDPWIRDPDGLDANFGFVFETMPRKEFNRKYPKWMDKIGSAPIDSMFASWLSDKEVMLCKYHRKRASDDTLVGYTAADGSEIEKLASEIKKESGQEIYEKLLEDIENGVIDGQTRKVENNTVEWFMIAGNRIVERGKWPGKYIPICRCVGRELVIDKTLDRKGHTRPLIDAQRMLNYASSMSVEIVALQPKSPFFAAARSIEGQEQYKTLNINGYAVLLYNDLDDEQTDPSLAKIAPPQRLDPPKPSMAHDQAQQTAERQMMMISGQFQAQMGENDTQSAASGKAIGERQAQGDTATYHFVEHMNDMERTIGIQLLDLYPKIYDTRRALHVMGEDGEKTWITIDPNQQDAVQELKEEQEDEEALKIAFNPAIGEYECVSDPGPDYATQRQEAWNALTMILQQSKELVGVCGDLLFKFGDFPGAEELMERLQKEIKATKPYLFDDKVDPQVTALQQTIQRLTALNTEMITKLAVKEIALKGKDEKRDVEAFNAETKRQDVVLKFLTTHLLAPDKQQELEHELMKASHSTSMQMLIDANAADLAPSDQPMNGAAQ